MDDDANTKRDRLDEYRRMQARLVSLMDTDPSAAVAAARNVDDDGKAWSLLRAATLCDAGVLADDLKAVEEASTIFARLMETRPDEASLKYNLSNALVGRARLDRTSQPDWHLATAPLRRQARSLLGEAARLAVSSSDFELASQMQTNLGNALDDAHRWVEAYDCYQEALALHTNNGVAAGCAARMLLRVERLGLLGHEHHLHDVALRLAHRAKTHRNAVIKFAGPRAADTFDALPSAPGDLMTVRPPEGASEYERFVAHNRLALSPVLEGIGHDPRRWDDAHISTLSEPIGTGATVRVHGAESGSRVSA
jgi:tetratricopeptide (TPR) repeat protein